MFWPHLILGSTVGLIVLFFAVTGMLLAYQRQFLRWGESGIRAVQPSIDAQYLPVEELIRRARDAERIPPPKIVLSSRPNSPVMFQMDRYSVLYMNPYTGQVLGHGAVGMRRFFGKVEGLHRWFGAYGRLRAPARQVKGAVSLCFLFLLISGLFLWWPRAFTWKHVRAVLWFRGGKGGRARDWNWHNTIGFWCAIPLLIIVLTGIVLAYGWANTLLFRATGNVTPPPDHVFQPTGANRLIAAGTLWQAALARAELQVSGWKIITMDVPDKAGEPILFTIDTGDGAHAEKQGQLLVDPQSDAVVEWRPFASKNLGARLRELDRWTHTGESLGWPGQTLAFIASAGAVMLVYTGLSMALARLRAYSERKRKRATLLSS